MLLFQFIELVVLCICRPSMQTGTKITASVAVTELTTIVPTTTDYLTSTMDSCDSNFGNCTNLNATDSPLNQNKSDDSHTSNKIKQHLLRTWSEADICTCNLQMRFCEISCCCDPDCSATDKAVFKYCAPDKNRFFDDRYCNYIKYIYVNNTPFEWEVNQDGVFCVLSRNLPPSHLVQNDKPIGFLEAFLPQRSFWYHDIKHILHKTGANIYTYGDSIKILKNDSSFDILRMPKKIITESCTFEEDVYFLVNEKSECSQADIDEENIYLSFPEFFSNFKIVANPKLVNLTNAKRNFYHSCPKNICLEIEPMLCDTLLNNCSAVGNTTNIKFKCSYDIKTNLNHCQNAVKRVHWRFYHNGTSGIYKVDILGVLSNFSYHFGREEFDFAQTFSWEFLWNNRTKNYSEIFSGNPGYIVGKPILIGAKVATANQTIVHRASTRFMDNYLVFPENVEGYCIRTDTYYAAIEFGYNMRNKCRFHKLESFNDKQNATEICRNVQKYIFDLWGIQTNINESMVFGLFGSALVNTLEDWSDVLYRQQPHIFINQTRGIFANKKSSLMCYNISTLLSVDVFHSRVDLKTLLNQQKVLGVAFSFENVLNLNVDLKKLNQSWIIDIELDLVSQVSFHDVTKKKERKFADPPTLDIRLPYDFFYPFIKIGNSTSGICPNFTLLFAIFALRFVCLKLCCN